MFEWCIEDGSIIIDICAVSIISESGVEISFECRM